jgi:hypothetical protein
MYRALHNTKVDGVVVDGRIGFRGVFRNQPLLPGIRPLVLFYDLLLAASNIAVSTARSAYSSFNMDSSVTRK